ncbi:MAG TPA: hypothetical protein VMI31_05460 [Fimbriimonadaceae bacterium]|nr:hypothetical protein [Fimbriimonadaceae bacterium]
MDARELCEIFVCAFFAIVMIQSGLDKVFDWKGNLDWLNGHFSKTFVRGQVKPMLLTVTALEVIAGFACAVSVFFIILDRPPVLPMLSLSFVCLDLLLLLLGQRIAKDYPGAASLAGYFIVALFGLYMVPGTIGG